MSKKYVLEVQSERRRLGSEQQ